MTFPTDRSYFTAKLVIRHRYLLKSLNKSKDVRLNVVFHSNNSYFYLKKKRKKESGTSLSDSRDSQPAAWELWRVRRRAQLISQSARGTLARASFAAKKIWRVNLWAGSDQLEQKNTTITEAIPAASRAGTVGPHLSPVSMDLCVKWARIWMLFGVNDNTSWMESIKRKKAEDIVD